MQISYLGFVQQGEVRSYQFEGSPKRRPGQKPKQVKYSMTADMAILSRFRIKFQDVPALCLRTLSAAVEGLDENDQGPGLYSLTEADVHAYCASIAPSSVRSDHRKRFRPKPTEQSQLQWPKKA